jgi:hypothetical protein
VLVLAWKAWSWCLQLAEGEKKEEAKEGLGVGGTRVAEAFGLFVLGGIFGLMEGLEMSEGEGGEEAVVIWENDDGY